MLEGMALSLGPKWDEGGGEGPGRCDRVTFASTKAHPLLHVHCYTLIVTVCAVHVCVHLQIV